MKIGNDTTFFTQVETYFQSLNNSFQLAIEELPNGILKISSCHKNFFFQKLNSIIVEQNTELEDVIIIHEDVWRNKNFQVKSRLHSILGLNTKMHARQCAAKQIEKQIAEEFLNKNHIQGYRKCATRLGLYKEEELVAVATFSSGRKMNRLSEDERSYELISFASKNNLTVVGGFDKLIKQFTKLKSPADIMTYVDVEWGNASAFEKLGFEAVGFSKPITFYVDKQFMRHKENDETNSRIKLLNKGNIKLVKTIHK